MERKSIPLEFKDIDNGKRTATIAHAVYNVIDRVGDISTKGMFTKSWQESKSIDFLFNHNDEEIVGNVTNTFEDEEKAYTEVKFGKWKLGDDVIEMAEAGVLRGASFGYKTEKKEDVLIKGRKVRKLKEVKHSETSLLTKIPAMPLAGIVKLNKSFETKQLTDSEKRALMNIVANDQSTLETLIRLSGSAEITDDLYSWISWNISRRADIMGDIRSQLRYNASQAGQLKSYVNQMESFCRNTNASDDCIKTILNEIEEVKQIISQYDTADTHLINEPFASRTDNDIRNRVLLLNMQFSQAAQT